jgi:hypothetical protein
MAGFYAEFVVASSQVPYERVTADHDRCGPVGTQTSHRAKPRLESPVVAPGFRSWWADGVSVFVVCAGVTR